MKTKVASPIEIIHKLMTVGFTRSIAGLLSSHVYNSLKWRDPKFIEIGMRMHRDNEGLWMDDPKSTVRSTIKELFYI